MKKSIIITDSINLQKYFKSILKQKGFDLVEDSLLSDVSMIKRNIAFHKNTAEIRNTLGEHIKQHGIPSVLALDYMMNLGLEKSLDPDQRKLLRTFIIAYAILLQGKGYTRERNIIVLIGDERMESHLKLFKEKPNMLFKIVKSENPKVNQFLDLYASDLQLAKQFFQIDYILKPQDGVIQGQLNKIGDIATMALRHEELFATNKTRIQANHSEDGNSIIQNPRDIELCYKFADGRILLNNNFVENPENKFADNLPDTLYVYGDWASVNQMESAQKIGDFFEKILKPIWEKETENHKQKEMPLSLFLTDEVSLEMGMLPSLIQLIEHRLNKIGKVSLFISPRNREKISKAAGFNFLQNYFMNSI